MTDDELSIKQFGASFKTFLERVSEQAPEQESPFSRRLRDHFGEDAATLPVLSEQFAKSDHANLQLALDAYLNADGRRVSEVGISGGDGYAAITLSQLAARDGSVRGTVPQEGPVEHVNVAVGDQAVLACIHSALLLLEDGDSRHAILVQGPTRTDWRARITLEVMTKQRRDAEALLAAIRVGMRKHNVYRGKVVSLSVSDDRSISIDFHPPPKVERDALVLPDDVIGRVERQTIGFARHKDRLRASGRHMKRGLLLHGPPGTGKTLTGMYLAATMKDRTTLLLTGRTLGLIQQSCKLARLLEPSLVVLEDVDLVAEERTRPGTSCAPLLFELLNEMDGISPDADVIFVLTTNRPELLEPALAARPGRIDLAVEVPLPDAECRARLIDLYGRGLDLEAIERDKWVARTEGVSAAFIRELLRKAALFSAEAGAGNRISDDALDYALHELAVQGGALTRSLLGAKSASG